MFEFASLVEDLNAVVVGVSDDYILIEAHTEAMRRVELTLTRPKLAKLGSTTSSSIIHHMS